MISKGSIASWSHDYGHMRLTCMRCDGTVTTATDSDDLSKARSP